MITIRPATPSDDDGIWEIFHAVIQTGDTYVFEPNTPRETGVAYFRPVDGRGFVAVHENKVVGIYVLRPNRVGLGSHIGNASFMVSPAARGLGAGRRMGEHCIAEAKRLGFRGLQFNFVVSTNKPAVRLWQDLGFKIVGTLPGAFRHAQLGFVDAYVMFRELH